MLFIVIYFVLLVAVVSAALTMNDDIPGSTGLLFGVFWFLVVPAYIGYRIGKRLRQSDAETNTIVQPAFTKTIKSTADQINCYTRQCNGYAHYHITKGIQE